MQKSSRLFLPNGGMALMMNTNSKILHSQDSNLSCYSPSKLTFSVPAFYLSSFMILVGERFLFSKNTDIFYVMVTKGVTGESPPLENCPQQTAPGRLPPLKLPRGGGGGVGGGGWGGGWGQFTRGNFLRSNSPSSSQREAAFQDLIFSL